MARSSRKRKPLQSWNRAFNRKSLVKARAVHVWTREEAAFWAGVGGRAAAKKRRAAKRRKEVHIHAKCVYEHGLGRHQKLCGKPAIGTCHDGRWMCVYHRMLTDRSHSELQEKA